MNAQTTAQPTTKIDQIKQLLRNPVSEYGQKEYQKSLKSNIMTTRFSDNTYKQNRRFRKHPLINKQNIYCVYSAPKQITPTIQKGKPLYVLELNNTQNKIMGVGKVQNIPLYKKNEIYDPNIKEYEFHTNYNIYSYTGCEHVETSEMDTEDQENIKILEHICFKGKENMKRSPLITQFPIRKLYQLRKEFNIHQIIEQMFEKKYKHNHTIITTTKNTHKQTA